MPPPSSSKPTSSPVTARITSGPVMNMCEVPSAITTKSVSAGEYTAPPALGPRISEIWGMTPDAATLRRKISANWVSAATPSWILDGGGARIQEGVAALTQFAEIFRRNVAASGVIPQISLILGPSAGGAVYSPALTDFVVMADGTSHMFITGPDVIRAVTGEDVGFEELGGGMTHNARSGVAHYLGADEDDAIDWVHTLLGYLPSNNLSEPPVWDGEEAALHATAAEGELDTLVPDSDSQPYDMRGVVEHVLDHPTHVVRLGVRVRHQGVELAVGRGDVQLGLLAVPHRWLGQVVGRQVAEQGVHPVDGVVLVRAEVVRDTRSGVVRHAAAELLETDVLAGDRPDHVGAGDEHVRRAVSHHHEVRQRGAVYGPAGTGPQDQRDLGDDARRRDVAPEDLGELGERRDTLLDPCAAAVKDPDQRHACAQGEIHHLGDLLAVRLTERATEDREVLGAHAHLAPVDRAVPDDDAVPKDPLGVQPERGRVVPDEGVELDEAALVEQGRDPLAGGLLAPGVLARRGGLVGGRDGGVDPVGQVRELGAGSGDRSPGAGVTHEIPP